MNMATKTSAKQGKIRVETVFNGLLVAVFVGSVLWTAAVNAMPHLQHVV